MTDLLVKDHFKVIQTNRVDGRLIMKAVFNGTPFMITHSASDRVQTKTASLAGQRLTYGSIRELVLEKVVGLCLILSVRVYTLLSKALNTRSLQKVLLYHLISLKWTFFQQNKNFMFSSLSTYKIVAVQI